MHRYIGTGIMISLLSSFASAESPPPTPKDPHADRYHGVEVGDSYRWLEDGGDEKVRRWSDAQNAYARAYLDKLSDVPAIRKRVTEIMTAKTIRYGELSYRGGKLFAIKREPPREQPFLVVIEALDDPASERVLLDPNTLSKDGSISIDWHEPSPDGKLVAVSLSKAGTELGDAHFYETATGKEVFEVVERVNSGTAGGDLAWLPDAGGVFYTRHLPVDADQKAGDLNFRQYAYFHKLGTPASDDRYELGKGFPAVAEIELEMDFASGRLLSSVQNGDGGEFAHYLRRPEGTWTQFSKFTDRIVQANFGARNDLLLISRADAPRGKLLRLRFDNFHPASAETLVPEGPQTIVNAFYRSPPTVLATKSRIFVQYQLGGPTEFRAFDADGRPAPGPTQQPVSAVGDLTALDGGDILFSGTSFVEPSALYRFSPQTNQTTKTWMAGKSPVDFSDIQVVREFAVSKDGTKVPLTLLIPKNFKPDGSHPAMVTGYGGYGRSIEPAFNALNRVFLDHGFVYVVANLRGGGEFGEPWHLQGNLTHKQNVFDDFAGVLRHLVERKYTSPKRLVIQGGSNGGLLMGAMLTQHSQMVKAVVSHVGIYDMLRVELSPNGVFNIPEFGTVKNPEQFQALFAYSPYHHVNEGVHYPATLFMTGANDPRVDPMQSRKMTARLQEATGGDAPILLRTSSNSGHGGDTALSERIEQAVDVLAFVFAQLGIKF